MIKCTGKSGDRNSKCQEVRRDCVAIQVGVRLPHREKLELVMFLKNNVDLFAWDPYEAPGRPVYYVSKSLNEAEVRYLPLKKAILAVVHATWKLPHCFQSHTVVVLTQLPLKSVLRSANYSGGIAKWGTILGAFDIKYMPHTSVKGQVLVDLVVEFAEPSLEETAKELHMDEKSVGMITYEGLPIWKVYVDRAVNQRGLGVELILVSPEGITFKKSLRLAFSTTNNEAEYEVVLVGMDMV
ncbi:uncharacterized protein LOC142637128 [Castanea sativa]|uniref:uncharacterized protein LOC142637128 n=1 Tax=Castanea sativa TaxID=21020 RepID=UPI003F64F9B6